MNTVIISGHLGQAPDLNYTNSGTPVVNLSVAQNRYWTDDDGNKQEKTTWHDVTVYGRQAETCAEYLSKGSEVTVQGSLNYSEFTKDGVDRKRAFVKAHTVKFHGGRSASPAQQADDEEIPF